jgi:hypothetical protein
MTCVAEIIEVVVSKSEETSIRPPTHPKKGAHSEMAFLEIIQSVGEALGLK